MLQITPQDPIKIMATNDVHFEDRQFEPETYPNHALRKAQICPRR